MSSDEDSGEFAPHNWPPNDADTATWHASIRSAQETNERRFKHGTKRMKRIEDAVAELHENVESIAATTTATNQSITEMKHALLGNNELKSPGTLELLQRDLDEYKAEHEALKAQVGKMRITLIKAGAVATAVMSVAATFGPTILEKLWGE